MARWLLCDYGQVLSEAPPPDEWEALSRLAAGPASRESESHGFADLYWQHRAAYDRGDVTAADYWAAVLGEPPGPDRLARLIELDVAIWLHPNQASVDAAVRVNDRGLRLAIFSNAPVEVAAGIDAAEWIEPFERRFYSCELRAVKPEPEAYTKVLAGLGVAPGDVVFFDDRPVNVAAAAELGIRAELFEHPAQFDAVGADQG